jgi:hypothetical protein
MIAACGVRNAAAVVPAGPSAPVAADTLADAAASAAAGLLTRLAMRTTDLVCARACTPQFRLDTTQQRAVAALEA